MEKLVVFNPTNSVVSFQLKPQHDLGALSAMAQHKARKVVRSAFIPVSVQPKTSLDLVAYSGISVKDIKVNTEFYKMIRAGVLQIIETTVVEEVAEVEVEVEVEEEITVEDSVTEDFVTEDFVTEEEPTVEELPEVKESIPPPPPPSMPSVEDAVKDLAASALQKSLQSALNSSSSKGNKKSSKYSSKGKKSKKED